MTTWTIRLGAPGLSVENAGGKGANLARLISAGLPVPSGFVLTTAAYREAFEASGMGAVVADALAGLAHDTSVDDATALDPTALYASVDDATALDPVAAETASRTIRAAFASAGLPRPIAEAVLQAYAELGGGQVAVRSSATAEDLPDLSFAGQQDTVLGALGSAALLEAVVGCWSSLWTARAMLYRRRNGIPEDAVTLAVVVQDLVPADVSGVLFTADPLTGHRGRMVIDATFGLGEALVGGQVEPDHYLADAATGRVLERTIGAKTVATRPLPGGGTGTTIESRSAQWTLTDAEIRQLVALGRRVQEEYASPQDIEWAVLDGIVVLLQSRAITSLYPLPSAAPQQSIWLSFGAVQGMLAPLTPLGRDAIRCILSGGARIFGYHVAPTDNPYLTVAGERLWIRVDRVLRNPIGRRIAPGFLSFIDPSAHRILRGLSGEGLLEPLPRRAVRHSLPGLARFGRRVLPRLTRAARRPEQLRDEFDGAVADYLDRVRSLFAVAARDPGPRRRAAARGRALQLALEDGFPTVGPYAAPTIAGPIIALRTVAHLAGEQTTAGHGVPSRVLELTRAVPRNVTTEMDLALWQVAVVARGDAASAAALASHAPAAAARAYAAGQLPAPVARAVRDFIDRYGMRGVAEIDLGRPRWREDPTDVFATLQAYLDIPPDLAPPQQLRRGAQQAAVARRLLEQQAAARPAGRLRARAVGELAERVQALIGGRETPKFAMVQALGVAREELLASGHELVQSGLFGQPDDIFFLTLPELERLPELDPAAVRALVAQRQAARTSELRRTRIPRILIGDGRALHQGLGDRDEHATVLGGSPVSPGVVEGLVRVVTDPASSELRHGEILVCAGTDPAWTPLFLSAAGLVTEVGGMMTHGSVVAREYGIPAVVGVHDATTRLRTGQRIRLDGSTGVVVVLND